MIQAAKERERAAVAASSGRAQKAYRGSGDTFDEEKLASILEVERALNVVDIKPDAESTEALLFTKKDAMSFLEILYRKAHELGLEATVDEKKFKQAIGIAVETRRLDMFEKAIVTSVSFPQKIAQNHHSYFH